MATEGELHTPNAHSRGARFYATCRQAAVRRRALAIPIVGITGSAGKTTTKEMLRRILSLSRGVTATPANRNAHPAVPILAAGPLTGAIVAEVGMNKPGMIAWQCRIIRPTIGVITNVGLAHVEACGGFAGVVKAKNELVRGIVPGGALVLNADDNGTKQLDLTGFRGRIVYFGRASSRDYRLVSSTAEGLGYSFKVAAEGDVREFRLRAPGEHLISDALAAMAAARLAGASWWDIRRGLAGHVAVHGRQAFRSGIRDSLIIDDSYNANPLSLAAGLNTLQQVAHGRPTVAVLGNMEEQGRGWPVVHRAAGRAVAAAGVNRLVVVGGKAALIAEGALSAGMPRSDVHVLDTTAGALRLLRRTLEPRSVVLVKGSNSTGLGRVARGLFTGRQLGVPAAEEPAARKRLRELADEQERIAGLVRDRQNLNVSDGDTVLSWPLSGSHRVTSQFGVRVHPLLRRQVHHDGIDISAAEGTTVRAAGSGTVIVVRRLAAYGRVAVIDHGQGLSTLYAHLADLCIREGDQVRGGDVIAKVGHSGRIKGTHLHFEVRRDGSAVDPLTLVQRV